MAYIEKGRAKTITKIVLWLVVIAFVASIFVMWGAQRSEVQMGSITAMQINGSNVTPDDLLFYLNFHYYLKEKGVVPPMQAMQYLFSPQLLGQHRLLERMAWLLTCTQIGQFVIGNMVPEDDSPDSREQIQVVAQFVGETVLASEAEAAGMRVTNEEIRRFLAQAYLDTYGRAPTVEEFNDDLSRFNLGSGQENNFMHAVRRHLLASRYVEMLLASVQGQLESRLPDLYKIYNQQATVCPVAFRASDYRGQIEVTEEELRQYFDERTDSIVIADMVTFDKIAYRDDIEITDAEIEQYYEARKEVNYTAGEERRSFRRILVSLPEGADEETEAAARARIQEIYDRLARPGEVFATVARDVSDDPSASSEEGVIADLTHAELAERDAARADAVFTLSEEEQYNTEPVRTADGLEILQLVRISPPGFTPLAEVRSEIIAELRSQRANTLAEPRSRELLAEARDAEDLSQFVGRFPYLTLTTNVAAIEGEEEIFTLEPIFTRLDRPAQLAQLLGTPVGELTEVMNFGYSGNSLVFFKVTSAHEQISENFELLRPAVLERLRSERSPELAEAAARSFFASVEGITDAEQFTAAAAEAGREVGSTEVSRLLARSSYGQEIGDQLFSVQAPAVLGPGAGADDYWVILLSGVSEVSEEEYEEGASMLRRQLLVQALGLFPPDLSSQTEEEAMVTRLLEAQISFLVKKADVQVNNEVIRQMFNLRVVS